MKCKRFYHGVGTPERVNNARVLSAWLGMTPKEYSSGNSAASVALELPMCERCSFTAQVRHYKVQSDAHQKHRKN